MVVLGLLLGLEVRVAIVELLLADDAHLAPPLEHSLLLELVLELFFVHLLLCSCLFELGLRFSLLSIALVPFLVFLFKQLVLQSLLAPLEVDLLLLVKVTWRSCAGRGARAVLGMEERPLLQPRMVTSRS